MAIYKARASEKEASTKVHLAQLAADLPGAGRIDYDRSG